MISTTSLVFFLFFYLFAVPPIGLLLDMRVPLRVGLESPLALDRPVDLAGRNATLLDEPMRDDDGLLIMKEVEHSIVHAFKAHSQLVDAISDEV